MPGRCSTPCLPARLDERVLDRIVVETRGNPLALLELPRGLTPGAARGRLRLAWRRCRSRPGSRRASSGGSRGCRAMPGACCSWPRPTRRATRPSMWRAAELLGIPESAADGANRTACWCSAAGGVPSSAGALGGVPSRSNRTNGGEVHRALAEATDPELDPDRRAWHRAQAASARTRTSPQSSSVPQHAHRHVAGLRRSPRSSSARRRLTPEPARRAGACARGRRGEAQAGALDDALALVSSAEAGPLDDVQRAQVDSSAPASRWRQIGGATRRPCCSRRPSAWSRSTRGGARDLPRRADGGVVRRSTSEATSTCDEWRPRHVPRLNRSLRTQRIFSSTGWRS